MAYDQLQLIKRYCNTSGIHLNSFQKDLLCRVLEDPNHYDEYETPVYYKRDSGRDYRDTWVTEDEWQYRINIGATLSIDKRFRRKVDGDILDRNWSWATAWHITDIRSILDILREIQSDL